MPCVRRVIVVPASLTALLLAAVTALMIGLAAPAAHAHDRLEQSSPLEGEALTSAPSEVVLSFSGELLEVGAEVRVLDGTGADVSDGAPVVGENQVIQPLSTGEPGSYQVAWRVVSGDGHAISDSYAFTVGPVGASTEPTPAVDPQPSSADGTDAEAAAAEEGGRSGVAWLVLGVLVAAFVGSAVLLPRWRRRQHAD